MTLDGGTFEPHHEVSPTDHALNALQLHGYRHDPSAPDPRLVPEDKRIAGAAPDIFDAPVAIMADTALDSELDDLLWSMVNMFHRATDRLERKLDDNEQAQKRGQREQDGSEINAVELERLIETGQGLIERCDSLKVFRDSAAEHYLHTTGSPWSPRTGSQVNHRALKSATIDSRDFIAERKRANREVFLPASPKTTISDCVR